MAYTIKINNESYRANNIYYCSPNGNDTTGDGTANKPFFSYLAAYNKAVDGDAICFLEGEYNYTNDHVYQKNDGWGHCTFSCEKDLLIFSDIRNTKINISYTCNAGRGYGFGYMKGKVINVHFKTVALKKINDSSWNGTLNSVMFTWPYENFYMSNCIFEFSNPYTKHSLVYDNNRTATTIKNCVFYIYDSVLELNYSGNIYLQHCVFNKQIVYNSFVGGGGSSATYGSCLVDSSMNTTKSKLLSYTSQLPSNPVYINGVELNAVSVTGITITGVSNKIYTENTLQLTATVTPSNATNKTVTWSSSNNSVATVNSNGLVTGKGPGTCTITAKANDGSNKSATYSITVKQLVTKITLDKTEIEIKTKEQLQLTAIIEPENATNKNIVWSSSDESVATVSPNGLVTAITRKGTCIITATAQDGSGIKGTCTINVISPVSEVIKGAVTNAIKSHKLIQEYTIISNKED